MPPPDGLLLIVFVAIFSSSILSMLVTMKGLGARTIQVKWLLYVIGLVILFWSLSALYVLMSVAIANG